LEPVDSDLPELVDPEVDFVPELAPDEEDGEDVELLIATVQGSRDGLDSLLEKDPPNLTAGAPEKIGDHLDRRFPFVAPASPLACV